MKQDKQQEPPLWECGICHTVIQAGHQLFDDLGWGIYEVGYKPTVVCPHCIWKYGFNG